MGRLGSDPYEIKHSFSYKLRIEKGLIFLAEQNPPLPSNKKRFGKTERDCPLRDSPFILFIFSAFKINSRVNKNVINMAGKVLRHCFKRFRKTADYPKIHRAGEAARDERIGVFEPFHALF